MIRGVDYRESYVYIYISVDVDENTEVSRKLLPERTQDLSACADVWVLFPSFFYPLTL